MRTRVVAVVVVLLGVGFAFATAPPASADFVCNSHITGASIPGGVTVPAGAVCYIETSTIGGTLTVAPGGFLDELDQTKVGGNAIANSPADFDVNNSTIGGAITVNGTSSGSPNIVICNNSVGGAVTLSGIAKEINLGDTDGVAVNAVAPCTAGGGNKVGGALTFSNNTNAAERIEGNTFGGGGQVTGNTHPTIRNNAFKGALVCSNNGTVTGSGNTAPSVSCPMVP
jgi:hypothetical protein